MAKTRTTTSHYEVQKVRRADWLQYWKDHQRSIVTADSVEMFDTPRRMKRGVIVSAARIVEKKGLHLMPPALAQLHKKGIAFKWCVIGDGPELARIAKLCTEHGISEQVELLGARDNTTVREALMHADVAALPCIVASDGERDGIPIFFVEAMALGVPVVTTPISGIPELIRDQDTGFLHATSDVQALADKLQAVLGDPQLARSVGERGRDEVHRTLDVNESATQLIAHIER